MSVQSISPIRFGGVSMVTATLGANDPELGQRVVENGTEYVFVFNAAATTIPKNYGVVTLNGSTTPYSVTVSSATSADVLIGVCKNSAIAASEYGWVVCRGITTVEMKAGASATVATGGMIEVAANGTFAPVSVTTGNLSPAIGKAMNTITSGTSGSALIVCF